MFSVFPLPPSVYGISPNSSVRTAKPITPITSAIAYLTSFLVPSVVVICNTSSMFFITPSLEIPPYMTYNISS